ADLRAFSDWLSPLTFEATQRGFFLKSTVGTGDWFLKDAEFQRWTAGHTKFLWCPGNPGVGKTMLASIVVEELRKHYLQPGVGVACIFCDYNKGGAQTITALIGSLLRQLMTSGSAVPDSLSSLYNCFKSRLSHADLSDLTSALRSQLQLYSRVYLVIDALDECSDSTRDQFVSTIHALAESDCLHVLITSRDISSVVQEFINDSTPRIDIRANEEDIHTYIKHRLRSERKLTRLVESNEALQNDIVARVTEKASGMFLLARLHIDSLASKLSLLALRKALDTLPKEIHASYNETMVRIRAQGEEECKLAHQVFMWLTYARRQLSVAEVQHALALLPDMAEIDPEAIVDVEILTSVCAGLVVVVEHDYHWRKFIRFVHYTAQEYFKGEGSILFPDARASIATTCIKYLSFDNFWLPRDRHVDDDDSSDKSMEKPLLKYVAGYWGHHVRDSEASLCASTKELLMSFLHNPVKVTRVMKLYRRLNFLSRLQVYPIHIVAMFGLYETMTLLLNTGTSPDSCDSKGATPLIHAAENGHSKSEGGRTPLSYAAGLGRKEVVQLLLQRQDVDADSRDKAGRTPLSRAAANGHVDVIIQLLQPDLVD
ncbi:hypothetical protein GGX14DRAFT_328154, partial [Mycena pura]